MIISTRVKPFFAFFHHGFSYVSPFYNKRNARFPLYTKTGGRKTLSPALHFTSHNVTQLCQKPYFTSHLAAVYVATWLFAVYVIPVTLLLEITTPLTVPSTSASALTSAAGAVAVPLTP